MTDQSNVGNPTSVPNAGTSPNNQDTIQGDGQQQQQQQQDNKQDNVDDIAKIWENPDNNQQQQQQQTQEPVVNRQDAGQVIADHIAGLNLVPAITNEVQEQFVNNDFSGLSGIVEEAVGNVYKQLLKDTSTIMDNKIKDGIKSAVSQSGNVTNATAAISLMEERMAFTKDPAISPVAKVILGRALKSGQDVDTGIDTVKRFFEKSSELSTGKPKRGGPPEGRPNSRPINTNRQINTKDNNDDFTDEENADWASFLTADQSQQ